MPTLRSFGRPLQALVVGSSGSIGGALVDLLADCPDVESVLACSRAGQPHASPKVLPCTMDILDEAGIAAVLERFPLDVGHTAYPE